MASLYLVVSMTSLVGLVGLGSEVGGWYLEKRHGQNAADGSALAGALMLLALGSPASTSCATTATQNTVKAAATDEATKNGFSSGVTANCPPASGSQSGNNSAVEVLVAQNQPTLFAGVFMPSMTVNNRAVAMLRSNGTDCIQGIQYGGAGGDVSFGGSTTINASGCDIRANATDASAISVGGSASVTANALISSGGCAGCSGNVLTDWPPAADPFASIYNPATSTGVTFSAPTTCIAIPSVSGTVPLSPGTYNGSTTCNKSGSQSQLSVTNGNTVNLAPGTYIFWNSSLSFQGGTIQCTSCSVGGSGVTIILTGSDANKIGSININGGATVVLNAPTTNTVNGTSFDGVLFYMDGRLVNSSNGNGCGTGNVPVTINGGAGTVLTGGMYFPSVKVCASGNATAAGGSASSCFELVANNVQFTGNSNLNVSGCSATNTTVAQELFARLVE